MEITMKTSWDVTIWVGEDVNIVHTVTGGTHTIVISGDETGRVALQFLDGLVSFRDEISRVVADWVPPMPEEDQPRVVNGVCQECLNGEHIGYVMFEHCRTCQKSWPF